MAEGKQGARRQQRHPDGRAEQPASGRPDLLQPLHQITPEEELFGDRDHDQLTEREQHESGREWEVPARRAQPPRAQAPPPAGPLAPPAGADATVELKEAENEGRQGDRGSDADDRQVEPHGIGAQPDLAIIELAPGPPGGERRRVKEDDGDQAVQVLAHQRNGGP